jgi:hypothetical protein
MKLAASAIAALLLAWPMAPAAAAPQKPAVQVRGQGCVEAGVETGCLVLKDLKTGNLYNLLVKGMHPAIGDGIEFLAVPHNGPAGCMQGIAVDVIGWTRKDSIRCGPAHANKK